MPTLIRVLATLAEDEIDIAYVALILAREIEANINIQEYSEKIDQMVVAVRTLTKGSTDPDYRIRALNTYLYQIYGMCYDLEDINATRLENRYL